MTCIQFNDVTFAYPAEDGAAPNIFEHFTGEIPVEDGSHLISLIGPNGSGKSTFLMLASGRLTPQEGCCTLFGHKVAELDPERKNMLASVIYQNMEFESTDAVQDLLDYVYKNGSLEGKAKAIEIPGVNEKSDLLKQVVEVFELSSVLKHGLNALSKGEIQRVLLAFSLLYGSPAVFMDEPLFAMEEKQKERALAYLKAFTAQTGTVVFISMHELELTRRFADRVILFYPNRDMDFGTVQEVMTNESLEKAYGVPVSMLKHGEAMTRESLQQTSDAILEMQKTTS